MQRKKATSMQVEEPMPPNAEWEMVPDSESPSKKVRGGSDDQVDQPPLGEAYIFELEDRKCPLSSTVNNLLVCIALASWGIGYFVGRATLSSAVSVAVSTSENYRRHLVKCSESRNVLEGGLVQVLNQLEDLSSLIDGEISNMPVVVDEEEQPFPSGYFFFEGEAPIDDELALTLGTASKIKFQVLSLIRSVKASEEFRLEADRLTLQINNEVIEDLVTCEHTLDESIDVLDEFSAANNDLEISMGRLRELSENQRLVIIAMETELEAGAGEGDLSPSPEPTPLLATAAKSEDNSFRLPAELSSGRSYSLNQAYLRGYHDASWWHPDDGPEFREKCLRAIKLAEDTGAKVLTTEANAYHEGFDAGKKRGRLRKKETNTEQPEDYPIGQRNK